MIFRGNSRRGLVGQLRLLLLLAVLLGVAVQQWRSHVRMTEWDAPLWVAVYPIPAQDTPAVKRYVAGLTQRDLAPLEAFFRREAHRYGIGLETPVYWRLGPVLEESPPEPPAPGRMLATMGWSLHMRYWAWRRLRDVEGPPADVVMFVRYFDPKAEVVLDQSVGLRKGLIGVVNAFATRRQAGANRTIIAHEFLHTLGATDKYDMQTLMPVFPDGYAEPERRPRLPQRRAEIMGGRIPVTPSRAVIPRHLGEVVVGPATAREIGWVR